MSKDPEHPYVSRGGLKLRHAFDEFGLDARGLVCADFGCNVGGFTDCLLQAGAAKVIAVDTGYGTLAWKLRQDPRVVVMERSNALRAEPLPKFARVDLVVMDMGWTPQRQCVPAAVRWLGTKGTIVTLIKPHYEVAKAESHLLKAGVLPEADAERIARRVVEELPQLGVLVRGVVRSPILGGKGKGNAAGNAEWLAWLELGVPAASAAAI